VSRGAVPDDAAASPPEPRLTVAAVARRLGVAPATLRTWDRRYGLGPTLHEAGAHRRYSRSDIARLEAMRRLVLDGVPPADAARITIDQVAGGQSPATSDSPPPGPTGRLLDDDLVAAADAGPAVRAGPGPGAAEHPHGTEPDRPDSTVAPLHRGDRTGGPGTGPAAGGPGGRVLALPGGTPEARGLARAAMALDAGALRAAIERSISQQGVVATWNGLLRPVLVAVGDRWAATGEGVEVEHLLAETAAGVLRSGSPAPEPTNGRPVLLACAPAEQHSLPLSALAAALAENGIGVRLLGGGLPAGPLAAAVRRTGPAALLVWAQMAEHADVGVLEQVPVLRPPVAVLAAGAGWAGIRLPTRVTHVTDLSAAVALVGRAVG
jgi:MerR family transcriptional regulator, light-induced transcriptional regulator